MRKYVLIVLYLILLQTTSLALNYTINFSGIGASNNVSSVVVQNLTQGTMVIVPTGNDLSLSDIPNSIDKLNEDKHIVSVYPNSVRDKSIVLFFAKQSGTAQINVYSIDGKMIIGKIKNLYAGENSIQLSLPKGAYLIRISGLGYSYSTKIISQVDTKNKPELEFLGVEDSKTSVFKNNLNYIPFRSSSAATTMLYHDGDRLLFKGISGIYSTIITDIPKQSKTVTFSFVDCTDIDGNHYSIIQIGAQIWMAENLNTTKYRNGELIGTTTPANKNITSEISPQYQWVYNGDEANASKYGRLYTWYTVSDSRNIAPTGWHVPTNAEWSTLENYLIANSFNYDGTTAGNKIAKSIASTSGWNSSPTVGNIGNGQAGNNSSGFTGLPGGYRSEQGGFGTIGYCGNWWSSEIMNANYGYNRAIFYFNNYVSNYYFDKRYGLSVRCLRD